MVVALLCNGAPVAHAEVFALQPSYVCSTRMMELGYSVDTITDVDIQVLPDGAVHHATLTPAFTPVTWGPEPLRDGTHIVRVTIGGVATDVGLIVTCPKAPGGYLPLLIPQRLLDSRDSVAIPPGSVRDVQVTGSSTEIPESGISAAMLNVTAVTPGSSGYLTVFPAGTTPPNASNVNFLAGQIVPNQVLAMLGSGGRVSILNGSAGATHVVVDIVGFFSAGAVVDSGGTTGVAPSRLLDTRTSMGGAGALAPGEYRAVAAAGFAGVPASDVMAVVVNVTAVAPNGAGYLALFADGASPPLTSNVNYLPGQVVANLAFVSLSTAGRLQILNGSPGATDVVIDVVGYVSWKGTPVSASGMFQPWTGVRVTDTRVGSGRVPAGQVIVAAVTAGSAYVGADIIAVATNVTLLAGRAGGYVKVWPGTVTPNTSTVNFAPHQVASNHVVAKTSDVGSIYVNNESAAPVDIVIDVFGFFLS